MKGILSTLKTVEHLIDVAEEGKAGQLHKRPVHDGLIQNVVLAVPVCRGLSCNIREQSINMGLLCKFRVIMRIVRRSLKTIRAVSWELGRHKTLLLKYENWNVQPLHHQSDC